MKKRSVQDRRIEHRLRLRDLHILRSVIQHGSMVKAASYLNVSQPAISSAIAALEAVVGVRLLDRSRKGVSPTAYGSVLLKFGQLAIEDLQKGIREIEFLSDPQAGELRIACTDTIANGALIPIIELFGERYPRVRLHVVQLATPLDVFTELEEQKVDLVLARFNPLSNGRISPRASVTELFDDRYSIVVGRRHPLARRRRIELADLVPERWILPPSANPLWSHSAQAVVRKAFVDAGLQSPEIAVSTYSAFLRLYLVSSGRYVSVLPATLVRLYADRLHVLPIDLPIPRWSVGIVTLGNDTLNPAANLFFECAEEISHSTAQSGT